MSESIISSWKSHQRQISDRVTAALIRELERAGSAAEKAFFPADLSDQLCSLALNYVLDRVPAREIDELAGLLTGHGITVASGIGLVRAIGEAPWVEAISKPNFQLQASQKLAAFQLMLVEAIARAAGATLSPLETSADAAGTNSQSSGEEILLSDGLQRILQLSAHLSGITGQSELLEEATSGICQALRLEDVTIFEQNRDTGHWEILTTTAEQVNARAESHGELVSLLNEAVNAGRTITRRRDADAGRSAMLAIAPLYDGREVLGAVLANASERADLAVIPGYIQAFASNVGALWRNLKLLEESQERARELEILHGRYVDNIWQAGTTIIAAQHDGHSLAIERYMADADMKGDKGGEESNLVRMFVGDHALGALTLPPDIELSHEEVDFVQTLTREMGNALNNAQLLQATQAYSTQLQVAAEVSNAASSILDHELLIQRVVDLIQGRFGLYYVGLFLVDERNEAVLQAGTGQAGQTQVEQGHRIPVGGGSMIGRAIDQAKAIVAQDVIREADWQPNPFLPDTRAELALPLRTRGRTIGALTVQSSRVGYFTADNVTVLQTVADQMATAIENASLFVQIQDSLAETNRLYVAGRKISEAEDAQTVFELLVGFAAESGQVDLAHVICPDPGSPDFLVFPAFWSKHPVEYDRQHRYRREEFSFSQRLPSEYLITIQDAHNDESLNLATKELFIRNSIRSAAMIAIRNETRWLATLVLDRQDTRSLSQRDLQPFMTLCDQAGVILSNQQLLGETKALYRVSRQLNQALSRERAFEVTIHEIVQYAGVEQCRIVLYDRKEQAGYIAAEYRPSLELAEISFPMSGDATYELLAEGSQPLALEVGSADGPSKAEEYYLLPFGLRATVLVPAVGQQDLIGFIALDSFGSKDRFTESNINFARAVADQFATTIESIMLYDEAMQRAQELVTLNQIGARISGTLDVTELASIIYEQVGLLLDNTFFTLAQYDKETGDYRSLLSIVKGEAVKAGERILSAREPIYEVLHNGRPVVTPAGDPLIKTEANMLGIPASAHPQSALWVPIIQESVPVGMLSVQSPKSRAYEGSDVQLLQSIATQSGLALSNAQLFVETRARMSEWRMLFNISQAATSNIDSGERLDKVAAALHENLNGSAVAIMIANEAKQLLETIAARGSFVFPKAVPFGEGLAGQVIQLGQPLIVNDLRELPEYYTAGYEGFISQLVVPLNSGGRTIGLINALNEDLDAFQEQDLRLLQTLSISLAATIQTGRLIEEIQAANKRLRELDRLKTQFLANMSHELRTPLNSIIGFSRVILKGIDGPISPEQEEDLNSIHNSGQHLLKLINDVLDLAKIEAGKMALGFEDVDLAEMAESVHATARGLVKDKDIRLQWDIEPNLPLVEADPIRLRQILLNFLSNASKFTEKGQIGLHISRSGPNEIHIAVSDTGIGISQEDYERLFEAFEQVDATPTRSFGGTGLGLPITKHLIELHQGQVTLESTIGEGSTFHITIPIRRDGSESELYRFDLEQDSRARAVQATEFTSERSAAMKGEKVVSKRPAVLIVDDEPGVIGLYERYLHDLPFQVIAAHSALEALDVVRSRGEQVQLVLLDINLPDLSGWEVLKEIRQNPAIPEIPVVVCSIDNDAEKAAVLGAQDSLLKPIVEDDLIAVLNKIGVAA